MKIANFLQLLVFFCNILLLFFAMEYFRLSEIFQRKTNSTFRLRSLTLTFETENNLKVSEIFFTNFLLLSFKSKMALRYHCSSEFLSCGRLESVLRSELVSTTVWMSCYSSTAPPGDSQPTSVSYWELFQFSNIPCDITLFSMP